MQHLLSEAESKKLIKLIEEITDESKWQKNA